MVRASRIEQEEVRNCRLGHRTRGACGIERREALTSEQRLGVSREARAGEAYSFVEVEQGESREQCEVQCVACVAFVDEEQGRSERKRRGGVDAEERESDVEACGLLRRCGRQGRERREAQKRAREEERGRQRDRAREQKQSGGASNERKCVVRGVLTQVCRRTRSLVHDMASTCENVRERRGRGLTVVGVGFTGTLASARPKSGDHRFYLSTRTSERLWTSGITLIKGMRTREEEDKISSYFLLKALADACKVTSTLTSDLQESEVPTESEMQFDEEQELQQIIDGKLWMKIYDFGSGKNVTSDRKIILSGSFNPLHDGHLRLMDIASSICEGVPCFEISAINADKPPLEVVEIKRRVEQFKKTGKTVIISNQPYFYKKAELFPGSAFVIGADTAIRLIDPKYYGDYHKMLETLLGCKSSGCLFLVGGRMVDGVFKVLEDLDLPEELKDIFISIPQERFRMDISSTEIRKNRGL